MPYLRHMLFYSFQRSELLKTVNTLETVENFFDMVNQSSKVVTAVFERREIMDLEMLF